MKSLLITALLLSLPAAAEVRFGLETQGYPLLPSFYAKPNKRFIGLSASIPVLSKLSAQVGISRSLPYWDGPYNDISNIHGRTVLLRAGAEYQLLHAGPARLFLGSSLQYAASSWLSDDLVWEDPPGPREFWEGRFTRLALEAAPRLELFRENQKVDWTLSLAFPYHHALTTHLRSGDGDLEARFRRDYLDDSGLGVRLGIGLAFGS